MNEEQVTERNERQPAEALNRAVDSDSGSHASDEAIYREEEAYLADVRSYLEREIAHTEALITAGEDEDRRLKAEAYAEGLEYKEGSGVIDSAQVQETLRSNFYYQEELKTRLKMLEQLLPQPYFARIDLSQQEGGPVRSVYLGLRDLIDERNLKQWVVDWRSPVASLYYDGDEGLNRYETPRGLREVYLVDKRQYLIRRGKLEQIYRLSDERYDRLLHDVLSQEASPRLRQIASTLQKEQNQVIRSDADKTLLLSGVAGSGKSSVAMHRAAWLLYRNSHLQAKDLFLISPNRQFIDYISEILPTLQGESLRSTTYEDLCVDLVSAIEAPFRRFTYAPAPRERVEALSTREFWLAWEGFLRDYPQQAFEARDLAFGRVTIEASEIERMWEENARDLPLFERAPFILSLILERYRNRRALWHRDAILRQLEAMVVQSDLRQILNAGLRATGRGEECIAGPADDAARRGRHQRTHYDRLDLALLASIVAAFFPRRRTESIAQLMIDEMQDLTLWEHQTLARLYDVPKTILGDPYQALSFIPESRYLEDLATIYGGPEKVVTHHFSIAYRSSWEISEFSKRLIQASDIVSLERYVRPVQSVHLVADAGAEGQDSAHKNPGSRDAGTKASRHADTEALIEELLRDFAEARRQDTSHSFAILCEREEECEEIQDCAEQQIGLELKRAVDFDPELPSSYVLTPEYARGMEFDSVWVFCPRLPEAGDRARLQALYVAATRALHELKLYTVSEPRALEALGVDTQSSYLEAEVRS